MSGAPLRLFALGLLLHESVYASDLGSDYFRRSFAPALGLYLAPSWKAGLHVLFSLLATWLLVSPHSAIARIALFPTLSAVLASSSVRLSNHLVLAWFVSALMFVDVTLREGASSAGVPLLIACAYGLAAFSKLNSDYLDPKRSCGWHLARLLLQSWGVDMSRVHREAVLTLLTTKAIILAETILAPGILLYPRLFAPLAIILHILFGLLCHVHFSMIMIACIAATAALPLHFDVITAAIAIAGALLGASFGNWRPYRHRAMARASHALFCSIACAMLWTSLSVTHSASSLSFGRDEGMVIGMAASLLFLLNGLTPYLGHKTAFSFAMFSNIRPDNWTHIVVRRPLKAFAAHYFLIESFENLPTMATVSDTPLARRALADLLMFRDRKYSFPFLAACIQAFPHLSITVRDEAGDIRTLGSSDTTRSIAWRQRIVLFPLTLPRERAAMVCE
jgi:hypothetical protein